MGSLSGMHLKKANLSFQQLPVARGFSDSIGLHGPFPTPCWNCVCLGLVQVLCMPSYVLWVLVCNSHNMPVQKILSPYSHSLPLALTIFPPPLASATIPDPLAVGIGYRCLFRTEHFTVSYLPHTGMKGISVLSTIYCRKRLLQWGLRAAVIYRYKDKCLRSFNSRSV